LIAKFFGFGLVTGARTLRDLVTAESIEVHGALWLLDELIIHPADLDIAFRRSPCCVRDVRSDGKSVGSGSIDEGTDLLVSEKTKPIGSNPMGFVDEE
jgi:hypothetical protein